MRSTKYIRPPALNLSLQDASEDISKDISKNMSEDISEDIPPDISDNDLVRSALIYAVQDAQFGEEFIPTELMIKDLTREQLTKVKVRYDEIMLNRKQRKYYNIGWIEAQKLLNKHYRTRSYIFVDIAHINNHLSPSRISDIQEGFNDFFSCNL